MPPATKPLGTCHAVVGWTTTTSGAAWPIACGQPATHRRHYWHLCTHHWRNGGVLDSRCSLLTTTPTKGACP
jgi:hypothetical protein